MSNPRDPSRLRQGLNPLLTTSLGGYHQSAAPLSAVSLSSTSHLQSAQPTPTTGSAIQPYNPQEWIASPAAGPERTHQFPETQSGTHPFTSLLWARVPCRRSTAELTIQLVSPPPPPPYSPPWNQRPVSSVFESSPAANTSAARVPPSNVHRPSPEPVANTSFPPPPGANGRGGSRERRFGLSSLRRHKEAHEQPSPPDPMPPISFSRPTPPPINIPMGQPVPQRTASGSSQGPPGARRAVSTSAIETPTSARSRSTSQTRWEPGMPLPPPPPGPPPASSRSQSVQSTSRTSEPMVSPPTRRPPPSNGSALGPVPPTPADWIDQDAQQATPTPSRGRAAGLTIDTTQPASSSQVTELTSSASLSRAGAVRLDKTIVQRRAESRTRQHESMDGILQPMQLTDIVVPSATTLSRRRTINKSTPRSGGRTMQDTPQTGGSDSQRDLLSLTPKALGSAQGTGRDMATPPFSPLSRESPRHRSSRCCAESTPNAAASQSLGFSLSDSRRQIRLLGSGCGDALRQRPIFINNGAQNCGRAFAASEAAATSDGDRVRLFADFIVSESRIRRERYASAIGAMGSEIFDLTRDLFRPMAARRESGIYPGQSQFTPLSSQPSRSHRGSIDSAYRDIAGQSSSAPTSANTPSSPLAGPPNNGTWTSNYMPSLSPILSLSVSGNGDGSSRGRPPSRWWESDSAGTGGHLMERSKRESKYMGMPKEAREALQWGDSPVQDELHTGISEPDFSAGYPPEKTGWHDQESALTPQPVGIRSSTQSLTSSASPTTPGPAQLDISRLVTLPPPYPRHHPAISDLSEIEHARARYQQTSRKKREEATKAASERRSALRSNLQQEINSGNMSFAEASAIEQDSNESEREGIKDLEKADFEHFQSQVVIPLNELLTGRITKANALFDGLASRLFDDVESAADMPQEEGDDKPELLEKLTLLKWIFEASEVLHRANYDLLSDRNDRYRDVVVTPYRLANNQEKVRSAEAFFAEDAAKRQLAFANEVLERTRTFQNVMEQNVVRGVEVQLSAFWDIAPPLSRLLDKVPGDLSGGGFRVQIPAQEYQENPTYHQHPLQYLFSLVLHAEKSTYQFIESQTNLLCLLHEVKEATAHAHAKVVQNEEGGERADALRQEEEKRLTEDLKEKVRVVQDQWHSALGEGVKGVKQTVGEWLLQTGGWDETLEDGGTWFRLDPCGRRSTDHASAISYQLLPSRLDPCRPPRRQPDALLLVHAHAGVVALEQRGVDALGAQVVEELHGLGGGVGVSGGGFGEAAADADVDGRSVAGEDGAGRELAQEAAVEGAQGGGVGGHGGDLCGSLFVQDFWVRR
ncbi:conserved hypothetical protein [Verticillium alfalfae VaMs.102]|uniref:Uncharacterized protein n=1 Tax=Verticillium alfalfae (strain VaMs.102 / ATCC MYA-4576 / FGSC 10136) TaxID=526221 RepID=C9STF2_VERA1|nr:conserved hypothetical protein [Verticillium alfalfae VaMs.102]EEY22067.1 conserved hypothetical protein [Verticillium alfalfae VaMs.102]